jgi:hypothetical protein
LRGGGVHPANKTASKQQGELEFHGSLQKRGKMASRVCYLQ